MIDRRNPNSRRAASGRRNVDRRLDDRLASEANIRFLRAGTVVDEVLHGRLLDVSASGIRILFEEPLGTSEKLLIEVRDDQNRCFNLTVQVIWTEQLDDGRHRVGCELCVELSQKQFALLRKLSSNAASN